MTKRLSEKELLKNIKDTNHGYMVMLVYWEPFAIGVQAIRAEWEIPSEGFPQDKTMAAESVSKWCKKYHFENDQNDFDYLTINIDKSPLDLYHEHLAFLTAPHNQFPNFETWRNDTTKLREGSNVPFHFQPYIERYILTGVIEAPYANHYLHTTCNVSRNCTVTSQLYMYGIPTKKELEYIIDHLNPMETLIGKQFDLKKHRHPHDGLKTDSDAIKYAKIFKLLEKERREKFIRKDYERAIILFGEAEKPEKQVAQTQRFRTMKSKAIAKQRRLFTVQKNTK